MYTNISSKKKLSQETRDLAKRHDKEWKERGCITGVHRDWGDDPEDFERKKGKYDIAREEWYPTYHLGGGLK